MALAHSRRHDAFGRAVRETRVRRGLSVQYDKPNRQLTLAATIGPALASENEKTPTAKEAVGEFVYSGGGFLTHSPDRGYRVVEVRDLPK